ncbi:MAG: T9SS type A sorting domain-containing protein [Bacteroidales bacterium]|nr:T9SS type A sorting domain-containing protein [Bacteroidales bacterium]
MKKIFTLLLLYACFGIYAQSLEMLSDGEFSHGNTYWSTTGSWSISNDTARNIGYGWGRLKQLDSDLTMSMEANTTYTIQFDIVTDTLARFAIYSTDEKLYFTTAWYSNGHYMNEFTTPSDIGDGGLLILTWNTSGAFKLDNISLVKNADIGDDPYFIAPDGIDAASGDIDHPWKTFEKAARIAHAGDTIYLRGGIWYRTQDEGAIDLVFADSAFSGDDICYSGEPGNYICFFGYPPDLANGDSVIFDFSLIEPPNNYPSAGYTDGGFSLQDMGYWHMKDLVIRNVWQKYLFVIGYGMNCFDTHNMIYENLTIYNIGGIGMFSSTYDAWHLKGRTDTTYFINCDFHHCIDSLAVGSGQLEEGWAGTQAVGLFVVNYPGCYYLIDGCRMWQNADDGMNNVPSGGEFRVKNTWAFLNGIYFPYLDYHSAGNAFKANSSSNIEGLIVFPENISHYYTNCIAAFNHGTAYKENKGSGRPSMNRKMYNNIAYKCSHGYVVGGIDPEGWEHRNNEYINNIAYLNTVLDVSETQGGYFETDTFNTWNEATGITMTDDDFITTDSAVIIGELLAPRQEDGSLPILDSAFQLAPGSDLIDAGIGVGLPFNGFGPDLGPFEYNYQSGTNNNYPVVEITSPSGGSTFVKSGLVDINVNANDSDGFIRKIEFYYNSTLLKIKSEEPWAFMWNDLPVGNHSLVAVATDNNGAIATSSPVNITVVSDRVTLFPNPNNGIFTFELDEPLQNNMNFSIISHEGKVIYEGTILKSEVKKVFDLSYISNGIYILLVSGLTGFYSSRFIKL